MKYLFLFYAAILVALLVWSSCAQAYSTDTVRNQTLMGGIADGGNKGQKTNAGNGNAVPDAAGVRVTGTGMQNVDAMYPQPGKPSGNMVSSGQTGAPAGSSSLGANDLSYTSCGRPTTLWSQSVSG